jgi:hypothetical protein
MLDAPYREAAHHQIDRQKRQPRGIGRGVAVIDGDAKRAAGQRRRNPDPQASERGGKKHGWNIGREEDVGPDQRQRPPRRRRRRKAGGRKCDAERRRRPGRSLPAFPEFVDQSYHGLISRSAIP